MNVKIIKLIDRVIGTPLCVLLSPFKSKKDFKTNKVLFIQLWGIGETILTLPAIKAFKQKYPNSKISLLCTDRNKDVYYKNDNIDNVIVTKLSPIALKLFILKNFKKFDLVIDFEEYLNISAIMAYFIGKFSIGYSHGVRAKLFNKTTKYNDKQHVVQTHLDLVRVLGADIKANNLIKLKYSKQDKDNANTVTKNLGIKSNDYIVGLGTGAAESARSRMWPKDRFAKLADELYKNKKAKIIFFGTDSEKTYINDIIKSIKNPTITVYNVAGKLSLKQAFAAIEMCQLFISNDTGTMHIAAAQGVKTIGLFGPNLPERWGPYGPGNISIYKGKICKFSPCINVHKGEVPECRFGYNNKCMKNIKIDDIIKLLK
jgi:heptosyltransferase II